MSYRDHLDAQKKYIETKKEARRLKEERLHNPRPPRLDPPPAPTSKLFIAGLISLALLPIVALTFLFTQAQPTTSENTGLLIWVMGSEQEFQTIKNWLEPEILANDLTWNIEHLVSRQDLVDQLALGFAADLLFAEQHLIEEIHSNQALAPLRAKGAVTSLEDCLWPLLKTQPFQKSIGAAIPRSGNIEAARHLITVLQNFAPKFTP